MGSSQNIAGANTVLNAIVAESLDYIATNLENAIQGGKELNTAIQELLPKIIKESKQVIFNGDGYSAEWHAEAERRGLPNFRTTVDALPSILDKKNLELLSKYKVYTEKELRSRFNILSEAYAKTLNVEGNLTSMMAKTMILPACLRYQTELAQNVTALKAAGADTSVAADLLRSVSAAISELQQGVTALDKALAHEGNGDPYEHAKYMRDKVLPAMNEVRRAGDKLEMLVADDLWPLPTYREMLFIK